MAGNDRPTKIKVNRVLHRGCGRPFYELEDEKLSHCPWCKKDMTITNDYEITRTKTVLLNRFSGNLSYR